MVTFINLLAQICQIRELHLCKRYCSISSIESCPTLPVQYYSQLFYNISLTPLGVVLIKLTNYHEGQHSAREDHIKCFKLAVYSLFDWNLAQEVYKKAQCGPRTKTVARHWSNQRLGC